MLTSHELQEQQQTYSATLRDFETCIDDPCVPGETKEWMTAVSGAYEELVDALHARRKSVHSSRFAEIAREDPALLERVDRMRGEDRQLAEMERQFARRIDTMQRKVAAAGKDEAVIKDDLDEFVADGQQLVSRVRRQEAAVSTWLAEAQSSNETD